MFVLKTIASIFIGTAMYLVLTFAILFVIGLIIIAIYEFIYFIERIPNRKLYYLLVEIYNEKDYVYNFEYENFKIVKETLLNETYCLIYLNNDILFELNNFLKLKEFGNNQYDYIMSLSPKAAQKLNKFLKPYVIDVKNKKLENEFILYKNKRDKIRNISDKIIKG